MSFQVLSIIFGLLIGFVKSYVMLTEYNMTIIQ